MNIGSWRKSVPVSETPRRPFPWARIVLVLALIGVAAYFVVPYYQYISADGLVQGDIVPVSPVYRVRVDKLLVSCADKVHQGEPVAIVSNFLIQADYEHQYQQSVAQLQLSRVALDEGVAQAQTNAAMLKEKYEASKQDAQRLYATFQTYDQGYQQGAIAKVDWEGKRNEWLSAVATNRSDFQAWKLAQQQVHRIGVDNREKISKDQEMADQEQALASRLGNDELVAPVSGYIVNCVERPSNVLEPSQALFNIFQPERAYIVAYFNPTRVAKIYPNEQVQVTVPGMKQPFTARVQDIYPNLAKLPPELTRYFWQHQQWSQYRPVRIALDRVPSSVREHLYYGAQVRVQVKND
jgi:multidrug resistance efflux pump